MSIEIASGLPDDIRRELFENASDAMFVFSEQGDILLFNDTACRCLGYSRDELQRLRPQDIGAPEYAAGFPGRIRRVLELGNVTFEMEHLHRDGCRIPVEIHTRLVNIQGRNYIVSTCRDIRERNRTELEYRSIIQASSDGYWAVNAQNARIIDVNETFCEMVGYSRTELLAMSVPDLEAMETPADTADHIRKIMETGHDRFETQHRHKDGRILEFEVSCSYAAVNGGVIYVFTRDISERKQLEAEARLAAMIFNTSTASIMATDADNRIVSVNPSFTRISGYDLHEVIGKNPRLLNSGRQNRQFYRQMWQTLQTNGHWEGEWWNRRKNGEEYAEQVALTVVRDAEGNIYRHVKIATDITERKRLDDLVWRQAHYDSVTGIPNRHLFQIQLADEIEKCRGNGQMLALYFIDLDGFKAVNDTFGHDTGDQLLREAAKRISRHVRGSDTVARLGGDEFTVMLTGLNDLTRVESVGRHFIDALSVPYDLIDARPCISASIGIAIFPRDAADSHELMMKADRAMYCAKNGGKNMICYAAN